MHFNLVMLVVSVLSKVAITNWASRKMTRVVYAEMACT